MSEPAVPRYAPDRRTALRLLYADGGELVQHARDLFREYAATTDAEVCCAGLETELAALPRPYAAPGGRLILAAEGIDVAGCVALRDLGGGAAELKRLYVRPAHRRRGIARCLVERAIEDARTIGYRRLRLDTLPTMTAALALYRGLGFRDIPPYAEPPVPGTQCLELAL